MAGQLKQCQDSSAAAELKEKASSETISKLQAAVKTGCKGSVDLVIKPGALAPPPGATGWNSLMNPCPEVHLKANFDSENEGKGLTSANGNANAEGSVTPAGCGGACESWSVWLGAGLGATTYHGIIGADYHRLGLYGTLDTQGAWTAGAKVKVLTGTWP